MAISQGTSTWSDISKTEESIVAWRQYLETNYGAKVPSEVVEGKPPNLWSLGERKVPMCRVDGGLSASAIPRCGGQYEVNKIESQIGGLVCPNNSAEELAEQLLGELDKAAAKVCNLITGFKSSFLIWSSLAKSVGLSSALFLPTDQHSDSRSRLWNAR